MQERDYDFCPLCHQIIEHGEHCCEASLKDENSADDLHDQMKEQEFAQKQERNYRKDFRKGD